MVYKNSNMRYKGGMLKFSCSRKNLKKRNEVELFQFPRIERKHNGRVTYIILCEDRLLHT